eukprot:symbB.v1.2.005237.t1/scaffold302.1/size234775/6
MVLELRNRSFQYVLEASPTTPAPTDWDGRNVIAVPERQLRNLYTWLSQESPLAILHELREVEDTLGILLFTVLQDPGGYELCLVSLESFDMAIARRTNASSTFPTNSELLLQQQYRVNYAVDLPQRLKFDFILGKVCVNLVGDEKNSQALQELLCLNLQKATWLVDVHFITDHRSGRDAAEWRVEGELADMKVLRGGYVVDVKVLDSCD